MKLFVKLVPVAVSVALMSGVANASDGIIEFNGKLISQTCTIKVDGAVSPTVASVQLPTVSTSLLTSPGQYTGRTNFEIELSNCAGAGLNAAAFFETGADVDSVSGNLINRGGATNVSLQLLDNVTNAVIKAGDSSQLTGNSRIPFAGGNAVLPYSVQYLATGASTAGTVTSNVTYSINYQ